MRHLYNSRVEVIRLNLDMTNQIPVQNWSKVEALLDPYLDVPGEMMVRIDLTFQRPGKDLPQPINAGRAPDRIGVMFFDINAQVRAGDRFRCIDGPVRGTFQMLVIPDPAIDASPFAHHMEVQVVEVAQDSPVNFLTGPEG